MAIEYKKNMAVFRDIVSVDEAEGLLDWLQSKPAAKVDMKDCTHLHPANLQVLMAANSRIAFWPADVNLCAWLAPALKSK
jgi:hypothetical protein